MASAVKEKKKKLPVSATRQRGFAREMKKNWVLYAMCVPALLFLVLFNFIPMHGIWMAFTKYNLLDGIFGSKFVGLDNFKYFFWGMNDNAADGWAYFLSGQGQGPKVIYNTVYLNVWGLILGLVFPVGIAIFMNEIRGKVFKKLTQAMMFFPYFLSWVVVGALVYGLFSTDVGLVNRIIKESGGDVIRFYAEAKWWKPILIVCNVWKWCGYSSITYMAAMASFDGSLYEAARVDGANKFQQIIYLTIPMLKPTMVVLTLMSVGRIFFGDFGMVYAIIGNNPVIGDEVAVIDTYVYASMRGLGFSYSTAIGLCQSTIGLVLVTAANAFAKKINDGEGLF